MKNIALCFLTYDNLSQPKLWKKFSISPKYNIYIHNKNHFTGHFKQYCIKNRVTTKRIDISLVKATLNLFKAAYKNKSNEYFVLLSDKCIPLYNDHEIYDKVMDLDNNVISNYNENRDRYDLLQDKTFFDKNEFMKQDTWMLLKRNTVKFFIDNDYTDVFGNNFRSPDEHYFINLLHKFNIPFINKKITYVNWRENSDLKKYKKKPKTYAILTNEMVENILKTPCLFMRKIGPECHVKYLN